MNVTIARAAAVLIMFGAGSARVAQGQGAAAAPAGRIGVTVALVDNWRVEGGAGVIRRHAGNVSTDLIILPAETATAEDLVSAAMTLEVLMERDGDKRAREEVFRFARLATVSPREVAAAQKLIESIRSAAPKRVPVVGFTHSGVMFIPSAATRAQQKAAGKWSVQAQP